MSEASNSVLGHYAALRHAGYPPMCVAQELRLASERAERIERVFGETMHRGGPDGMQPAFAKDQSHIAAVRDAGGYPVLPEHPTR